MGYWRTLHLFDDQKFHRDVVPVLRGERGDLAAEYYEFMKVRTTGGIDHIPKAKITEAMAEGAEFVMDHFRPLTDDFKQHPSYSRYEDLSAYLDGRKNHYKICSFFEHYIFTTCADFFPHATLGKYGVQNNLPTKEKSLASSITEELDRVNTLFNHYMTGIVNWLTHEETALLYLDRNNLIEVENNRSGQILHLLEVARENNLGLIHGIDMRERLLASLPEYKLLSKEKWKGLNEGKLRTTMNG